MFKKKKFNKAKFFRVTIMIFSFIVLFYVWYNLDISNKIKNSKVKSKVFLIKRNVDDEVPKKEISEEDKKLTDILKESIDENNNPQEYLDENDYNNN